MVDGKEALRNVQIKLNYFKLRNESPTKKRYSIHVDVDAGITYVHTSAACCLK
jgi:hypothetical protein